LDSSVFKCLQFNSLLAKHLVSVALPLPLRREFTYQLADKYTSSLLGSRVKVSFGNRRLVGFISGEEKSSRHPKIKSVEELIDNQSLFNHKLYSLLCWAANYYHTPLGKVLETALPVALRKGEKAILKDKRVWKLNKSTANQSEINESFQPQNKSPQPDKRPQSNENPQSDKSLEPNKSLQPQNKSPQPQNRSPQPQNRSPQQSKILDYLSTQKELNEEDLARLNFKRPTLRALMNKGLIKEELVNAVPQAKVRSESPVQLTDEQQQAVNSVIAIADRFNCFLLEGPTNSGKTEVYIEIIRQMVKQGKQALFMVPEISLSPQTLVRLEESLRIPLGLMHSQMNNSERLQNYLLAAQGQLKVVIGTRSTIFIPFASLGCIVIDEEQDMSYKQDTEFRYNAKHLAIKLAQLLDIPVILGSATPSLESYYNVESGRYKSLRLTQRINRASQIPCRLLDMKQEKSPLPAMVMDNIAEVLRQGSQVLVFINRRGFAPTLCCSSCGWVQECSQCERPMTLHKYPPLLACHICEKQQAVPHLCPSCHKGDLKAGGFATQRLADMLAKKFPDFPVLRIDRDSMRKKASYVEFYQQVRHNKPCILVGTQIIAKGHDFSQIRLAVIANCDQGLISPDFHSVETTAQLITQVIGRVGRRKEEGKQSRVLLPTYYPKNSTLVALLKEGYSAFAQRELQARKQLGFPPYTHFAYLRAEAVKEDSATRLLRSIKVEMDIKARKRRVSLLGPIECGLPKRNNYYRRALIIRSASRSAVHFVIAELTALAENIKLSGVRWHADIDPLEAP